jgi:hypothetical protein
MNDFKRAGFLPAALRLEVRKYEAKQYAKCHGLKVEASCSISQFSA